MDNAREVKASRPAAPGASASEQRARTIARIALVLAIIAQAVLCCWLAFNKVGLFQDESYTFLLANESWLDAVPEEGVVYQDGEPWQSWASVEQFLGINPDKLYENQATDNHPPLYYTLFSLAYSLVPGATTPVIGVMVNAVFALAGTVLLYFLCRALRAPRSLSVALCAVWAVNAGMANSTVYLRMYCLLSVFFTAAALVSVRHLNASRSGIPLLVATFATTACGFLTQYFFVLFAFPLYLMTGIALLARRRIACAAKFAVATLGGIACGMLAFPPSVSHLFSSSRGQGALERAATGDSFWSFLVEDWRLLNDGIFGGLLPVLLVALCVLAAVALFMRTTGRRQSVREIGGGAPGLSARGHASLERPERAQDGIFVPAVVMLFVSSVVFVALVARVAPYASIRYLMAVDQILLISVLLLIVATVRALFPSARAAHAVVLVIAVGIVLTLTGWAHGIKYLDQETDSVAALYDQNEAMVVVSEDVLLQQSVMPDALAYGTSVYFYHENAFNAFDFAQLGQDISLYVQPGLDAAPYLEELSGYPNASYEHVGRTIDNYDVYDVTL